MKNQTTQQKLDSFFRTLRKREKRTYAAEYLKLLTGQRRSAPEEAGLGYLAKQAIRMHLEKIINA